MSGLGSRGQTGWCGGPLLPPGLPKAPGVCQGGGQGPPSTAPGMPPPCFSSLAGGCVLGGSRSPTVPLVISFCNSPLPLYKPRSPRPRGSLSQGHCLAAWAPGSCVSGPARGRQCCPRPPGARQKGAGCHRPDAVQGGGPGGSDPKHVCAERPHGIPQRLRVCLSVRTPLLC